MKYLPNRPYVISSSYVGVSLVSAMFSRSRNGRYVVAVISMVKTSVRSSVLNILVKSTTLLVPPQIFVGIHFLVR